MKLTNGHLIPDKKVMFKRGASILPSLFTLGNMFLGYCAIIQATKGNVTNAVNLLFVAGILDMLDGRIARMTGTTSEFGKELDSLSDFLSFGLAPAMVLYFWGFNELGRFGWLFVFLLPLAGAIRLARFNIQGSVVDKRYFVGLPIPAAAGAAMFPLYYLDFELLEKVRSSSHTALLSVKTAALVYVVLIAFCMVSTIKYRSFKHFDMKARKPAPFFFFVAFLAIVLILNHEITMIVISVLYLFSGPTVYLFDKLRKPGAAKEAPGAATGG